VLLTKYLYLFVYTHNGDGTFQNIIGVQCKNHMKRINRPCGDDVDVEVVGTYS